MFGTSAPFGSSSTGFGQQSTTPAFGAPAPFGGGGGGFGAPAPATGFGTPAPAAPGGFGGGGFGTPAPAPAFGGGGSTFGAPAAPATSAFGSSAGGGGFGSGLQTSSPFGAPPAPAPSGGMFGAPAPAPPGGLFGSGTMAVSNGGNSGFGGGGFGATPAPAPAFGSTFGSPAPAPATGLFGAPAPSGFGAATNNAFGGTSSNSAFGAPAPAGGMFGAPAAAGGGGTKMTPFAVTSKQDGSATINLQSITAMAQYEQKSCEELRFEDYNQGNRGTGNAAAGNTGGFGGFGAPAPSSGLFGAPAPAPATFGAPAPAPATFGGGFGSTPAPASGFGTTGAFGAPAPSAFGAPAPAPFGAPAPATGGFGATAFGAPAPSTGLFGAPAPAPTGGGIFGAPAPAPGGLFGSTPPPAPAFGPPAPGLFASPTPAPAATGLFGTPAPAPFGAPAPAPFGAPAPGAFGGFGTPAPAPTSGLFGTPAPPPFGAPAPSSGIFGAPAPGGIFGAPAPSAFASPAPAGSLFGTATQAPGGVFGAPAAAAAPQVPAAPALGSIMPPATNEILAAQLTALENKRKEMEKSDNFRPKRLEASSINGVSLSESEALTSLTPVRAPFPSYRASPRSTSKIRPRGFASPEKKSSASLSRLGSGGRPMATPDSTAVASTIRLVIKPSPKPRMKLSLEPSSTSKDPILKIKNSPAVIRERLVAPEASTNTINGANSKSDVIVTKDATASEQSISATDNSKDDESPKVPPKNGARMNRKVAPLLTKEGYTCHPSIKTLEGMTPEDLAAVQGFSVEREGVGKIEWEGAVDIRDLNLDSLVVIDDSPQSASVYTVEEREGRKPPVGTKLNRPAIITLENVFPPEGMAKERFEKRVARSTKRNSAELISYNSASGEWKFRVLHFSRYALTDDDSESEDEVEHHFESGEREGRSPGNVVGKLKQREDSVLHHSDASHSVVAFEESRSKELARQSDLDVAMSDAKKVFEDFETEIKQGVIGGTTNKFKEIGAFSEESKEENEWNSVHRCIPTAETINLAGMKGGICASIARKANMKSSSVDFGLRMGNSFRAGWAPDGSFVTFGPGGKLSRRRPVFSAQTAGEVHLLEKHRESCNKMVVDGSVSDCPQFCLPSLKSDGAALKKAFKSYKSTKSDNGNVHLVSVASMAFSLLAYLVDGVDKTLDNMDWKSSSSLEVRRIHAITNWLVDSCSKEVDQEIDVSISQGRKLSALLAAVTGGDKEKACNLASDLGFFQLSTMLSSRHTSRNDMLRQVLCWTDSGATSKLSEDFLRIYFLIGGDLKMEEDIYRKRYSPYDWRRRLAMSLVFDRVGPESNLSSVITAYEEKVSSGVAPYPQPQYLQGTGKKEIQCVLYRLLRLDELGPGTSLIDTINPLGYSNSAHDYSLAFHLASAISAMEKSSAITLVEMESLVDSYAAQLLSSGKWEWAVYVSLCSFLPPVTNSLNFRRAKALIIQNYTKDTPKSASCREFLEASGIPSTWFEEALALRRAIAGDSHGYLCHMVHVSSEDVAKTLEKALIPNMFFMNQEELDQSLKLLEVFAGGEDSLAFAMYNFFQLYQSIIALDGASRAEIDSAVPSLSETCRSIEQVLISLKLESTARESSLRFAPTVVPFASFLAEALSQLSLFKMQLKALESEIQISSSVSQILNLSQPKQNELREIGTSGRESICKWLL